MAEGTGRQTFTDLTGAPPEVVYADIGFDAVGNVIQANREELSPYAKTKRVSGALSPVLRNAPRQSVAQLRLLLSRARPDLSDKQVDARVRERLAGLRTTESTERVSWGDYPNEGGDVTLECRKCHAKPRVNRKKLSMLIDKVQPPKRYVLVSPGGEMSIGSIYDD